MTRHHFLLGIRITAHTEVQNKGAPCCTCRPRRPEEKGTEEDERSVFCVEKTTLLLSLLFRSLRPRLREIGGRRENAER